MANAFLPGLATARHVSWGKTFNWDFRFTGGNAPPYPFDQWFPATDCDRVVSQLQTHTFVGFGDTYDIPYAAGARTFTVTFGDDDHGTLQGWFTTWMETAILGNPDDFASVPGVTAAGFNIYGTARLADIVRTCQLARLDFTQNIQRIWELQVFPIGPFNSARDSNSAFQTHIVTFAIAGLAAIQ